MKKNLAFSFRDLPLINNAIASIPGLSRGASLMLVSHTWNCVSLRFPLIWRCN